MRLGAGVLSLSLLFSSLMGVRAASAEIGAATVAAVLRATPEALSRIAHRPGLIVAGRLDHAAKRSEDGAWVDFLPEAGFAAVHPATNSVFLWNGTEWTVESEQYRINVLDWGAYRTFNARKDPDFGLDSSEAIQAAIDRAGGAGHHNHSAGKNVYLPGGCYLLQKPLNLTSTMKRFRNSITFYGDGKKETILYANTGGLAIDVSGSIAMTFRGFTVEATLLPNPSTCGFLFARAKESAWSINFTVTDVGVEMSSNPAANDGIGTVGIWNFAGEHHTYTDIWLHANLPLVLTRANKPEGLPGRIGSVFVEDYAGAFAGSANLTHLTGNCVLVAYDYYRPALFANRVACVYMSGTYLSTRPCPFTKHPPGKETHAIHFSDVQQFQYRGQTELARDIGFMKVDLSLVGFDIDVVLGRIYPQIVPGRRTPNILLTGNVGFGALIPGLQDGRATIRAVPAAEANRYDYAVDLGKGPHTKDTRILNAHIRTTPGDKGGVLNPALEKTLEDASVGPTRGGPFGSGQDLRVGIPRI